jgi:hypothetical protein
MKKITSLYILISCLCTHFAYSQGCVAVRHMSCSTVAPGGSSDIFKQKNGTFMVNFGYRYFESFRHFRGDVQEKDRVENGTQVINISHAADLGVTYILNPRLSFSANLPLLSNDRSSLYEHYGNSLTANPQQLRFHTQSKGIGDMRISGSYWLFNPAKLIKGNVAIGFGIKLPTGNYGVTDEFHKRTKEGADYTIVKPVDQSIQLGDGGVGFSLEVQGYQTLAKKSSLYYNGFYLFNPKNVNSTDRDPTNATVDPIIRYFSVADQFAGRVGVNQVLSSKLGLSVMLGGRIEGVPSSDLVGKSEGYRRPGYIVSAEPGLSFMKGKVSGVLSVPIALYRNRTKSFYDKQDPTGQRHGDAAFADYSINFSLSKWF